MILPTEHIRPDRSLLGVGAEVLAILVRPMTISTLWDGIRSHRSGGKPDAVLDYRRFVLALDLLYTLGAVDLDGDLIRKVQP